MNRSNLNHNHGHDHEADARELFRLGSDALDAKNFAAAYRYLHMAVEKERSPQHLSQFAVAVLQYTGNLRQAVALCQEAIKDEPRNPTHFYRLGMIYLISGRKKEAVRIFNLGLRLGRHPGITRTLRVLGHRDKPVLPFLERGNPLNKYLGKIRSNLFKRGR